MFNAFFSPFFSPWLSLSIHSLTVSLPLPTLFAHLLPIHFLFSSLPLPIISCLPNQKGKTMSNTHKRMQRGANRDPRQNKWKHQASKSIHQNHGNIEGKLEGNLRNFRNNTNRWQQAGKRRRKIKNNSKKDKEKWRITIMKNQQ